MLIVVSMIPSGVLYQPFSELAGDDRQHPPPCWVEGIAKMVVQTGANDQGQELWGRHAARAHRHAERLK